MNYEPQPNAKLVASTISDQLIVMQSYQNKKFTESEIEFQYCNQSPECDNDCSNFTTKAFHDCSFSGQKPVVQLDKDTQILVRKSTFERNSRIADQNLISTQSDAMTGARNEQKQMLKDLRKVFKKGFTEAKKKQQLKARVLTAHQILTEKKTDNPESEPIYQPRLMVSQPNNAYEVGYNQELVMHCKPIYFGNYGNFESLQCYNEQCQCQRCYIQEQMYVPAPTYAQVQLARHNQFAQPSYPICTPMQASQQYVSQRPSTDVIPFGRRLYGLHEENQMQATEQESQVSSSHQKEQKNSCHRKLFEQRIMQPFDFKTSTKSKKFKGQEIEYAIICSPVESEIAEKSELLNEIEVRKRDLKKQDKQSQKVRWTTEEHKQFLRAMSIHGADFQAISANMNHVKSPKEVHKHAFFFLQLVQTRPELEGAELVQICLLQPKKKTKTSSL